MTGSTNVVYGMYTNMSGSNVSINTYVDVRFQTACKTNN